MSGVLPGRPAARVARRARRGDHGRVGHRDYNTISVGMIDDYFASLALEAKDAILTRNREIVQATSRSWTNGSPHIRWCTTSKPRSGTTALLGYDLDVPSRQLCVELVEQTGVMLTPAVPWTSRVSADRLRQQPEDSHRGLGRMGDFRPLMHVTDRAPAWTLAVTAIVIIQLGAALSTRLFDAVGTGGTGWLRLLFGGLIFIAIARPRLADYRPADLRIALVLGLMTGTMTLFFLAAIDRIPWARRSRSSSWGRWAWRSSGPRTAAT